MSKYYIQMVEVGPLTGTLSWSREKLQTIQVCPTEFSGGGALESVHI